MTMTRRKNANGDQVASWVVSLVVHLAQENARTSTHDFASQMSNINSQSSTDGHDLDGASISVV